MKLNRVITVLLLLAGSCPGEPGLTRTPERPGGASPVLVASTNTLIRILGTAASRPAGVAASELYANHALLLNPSGNLKSRFDLVSSLSTEYELMSKLAECLIGSRVKVRRQPDGSYLYINEARQTYRIDVIHDECDRHHFQGVYYFTGQKVFVKLKALMHLESRPGRDGGIEYDARIYAGSDSHLFNFFSRLSLIKSYLVDEVTSVVTKFDAVYDEMLKTPEANLRKLMEFRDPKADLYFTDQEIETARTCVGMLLDDRITTP